MTTYRTTRALNRESFVKRTLLLLNFYSGQQLSDMDKNGNYNCENKTGPIPTFCTTKPDCCGGYCAGSKPTGKLVEPDKLIFIAEWYDREAELLKKFLFTFHTIDETVDIADLINHRRFLKRMKVDTVTMPALYIGNVVNIFSRPMTLVEYADSCTRQYLEPKTERAFIMVKPEAVPNIGFIMQRIEKCFRVMRVKMAKMDTAMASRFYDEHEGQEYFASMIDHITSGPLVAFLLVGEQAIEKAKNLLGDEDPAEAKLKHPTCLRALYGLDKIRNGFHVSESLGCVIRDAAFFFPVTRQDLPCVAPNTAILNCTTCCIIKPHIVKEGKAGLIISDITAANFTISAMEMFYLDRTHAEEFYEIYKGVLGEYSRMTDELSMGPCLALEIGGCGEETPQSFRSACGPYDPELGRKLRPLSLRARYGLNTIYNAVHCTDLPEDAHMELEYLFRILNMKS